MPPAPLRSSVFSKRTFCQKKDSAPTDITSKTVNFKSPEEWDRFLVEKSPKPDVVRELITGFSSSGQHAAAIGLIEASIRAGQVQPWMHEVLALSMELDKRPKAQIERVMLSGVDVGANDPASLAFLATYFSRLGRPERALSLLDQAVRQDPTRVELYLLATKIAMTNKAWDTILWSAPGLAQHAWGADREEMLKLAEAATIEATTAFRQKGETATAEMLIKQFEQSKACDLSVKVEWNGAGDVDLLVDEPGGSTCSHETPRTPSGGLLSRDGFGPRQENCQEEYVCPFAFDGEYRIRIRHVQGDIVGKRVAVTITRRKGQTDADETTRTIILGKDDQELRVLMRGGRRQAAAPVPDASSRKATKPTTSGNVVLSELRGHMPDARNWPPLAQVGPNAGGGGGVGVGVALQAPQVTSIAEGVSMAALAVVSGDRRYVRLTLQPNFTAIRDVLQFSTASGPIGR